MEGNQKLTWKFCDKRHTLGQKAEGDYRPGAVRKLRQEECCRFKVSLGDVVRLCLKDQQEGQREEGRVRGGRS